MKTIKRITSVVLSLIFCFGFAVTSFADTILSTQQSALSKIAPEIMQAFEAGEKKVPVYIWLTDINQDTVEAEVEQKTGLTRDTLSVNTEIISAELAQAITNESTRGFSEKTTTEFNSYLERTAQARELERINTDTYISERRAIARSKIEAKNTAFVSSAEISETSIIFQSAYAPMIIAELSEYQVQTLAGRMDVVKMAKYEEQKIATDSILTGSDTVDPEDMQTWQNNVGLSKVRQIFGLTGAGVKIGIVEKALVPTDIDALPSDRFIPVQTAGNYSEQHLTHARYIAQLYAGEQGIAKDATVYCVAWEYGEMYEHEVEKLLEQNVKVINTSAGSDRYSAYTYTEAYVDYIVFTHNVVIVKSGGNFFDVPISSPGNAFNIITVGGFNDSFTADIEDDEMCAYSFDETAGGCMKPDVVASAITPWKDNESDYVGRAAGTSAAAPIVSGYIALMLELQPALVARPEVVKAIVLASCHRKVAPATVDDDLPELMTQGITNKQGAGVFDPLVALIIASCRTYSGFVIAENDTQFDISFNQSQYDATGMNMSFTWLRPNSYYEGTLYIEPNADFDIRLWNYFDLIGQSSQSNSSTEMIYHLFSGAMSETYMLGIDTYSGNGFNNRIAYAWSFATTDNQNNREGLFYLKNVATGYYLQPHVANDLVIQESFSGNLSQLWLMAESEPETNMYIVKNMATSRGYLSYATPSNGYYMVATSDIRNTLTMFPYRGSAFALTRTIAGQKYVLGMLSDLDNATAVWISFDDYSDLTDYELWYPESRDYHFCDVDMDRTISAADARLILRYAVGLESFTVEQQCLGDIDRNDSVNAADARLALRYSVGLYT